MTQSEPAFVDEEPTDPSVMSFTDECEPGKTYGSRFKVISEIASGGMGVVYEAHDLKENTRVAFKVLRRSYQLRPRVAELFLLEGKFLQTFSSPAIPRFFAYGVDDACGPYVAMEILRGKTLAQLGARMWSQAQVALLGMEIALALHPMHQGGVIHRDLKPQNLFLAQVGKKRQAKILDWGIAKMRGPLQSPTTGNDAPMGTLRYMAPEQIKGKRPTPAVDVYALAIVLYELLSKRFCYGADAEGYIDDHTYSMWHQHGDLIPLQEACDVLPAGIAAIMKGLARDPNERHADMRAFADALSLWHDAAKDVEPAESHRSADDELARDMRAASNTEAKGSPTLYGVRAHGGLAFDDTAPAGLEASTAPLPNLTPVAASQSPTPLNALQRLSEKVVGRLEVLDGPVAVRFFDLESGVTTGLGRRPDLGIVIDESSLSAHHASFGVAANAGRVLLRDEKSRNGSAVNGEKLAPLAWRPLQHGDRIQLGRVLLMFHSVARIVELDAKSPVARGGTLLLRAPMMEPSPAPANARPPGALLRPTERLDAPRVASDPTEPQRSALREHQRAVAEALAARRPPPAKSFPWAWILVGLLTVSIVALALALRAGVLG
ncbi:MAG: protein kinase [Polyangiaceae bacterium]